MVITNAQIEPNALVFNLTRPDGGINNASMPFDVIDEALGIRQFRPMTDEFLNDFVDLLNRSLKQ